MYRVKWILCIAAVLLAVCANFEKIGKFASEGNKVSALVKADFDGIGTNCHDIVGKLEVFAQASGGGGEPTAVNKKVVDDTTKVCAQFDDAIPKMTSATITVIDGYHEALGKLAKGDNWTLEADLKGFTDELGKLKLKDGDKIIKSEDIEKFSAAINFIAKAILDVVREREARKLLAQDLPWKEVLRPLRAWYGDEAALQILNKRQELHGAALACTYLKTSWGGVESRARQYIACGDSKRCEPIRAAEMAMEAKARAGKFAKCEAGPQGAERSKVALETIDAWYNANEELRRDAFKMDSTSFERALKNLEDQRDRFKKAF